ncbi:hypothetical protein ABWK29_27245 [Priestia megaterium]|uniref:Uncharacterized protein n=1 Tax=Priestia megaterium TaxID=1404 RepID=A0AAE5P8F3_PRIMG|nr:hypothetical protein [Priestia megaterium]RFB29721.1 hypothetical protein DZB87_04365 [Bacillus sp. ALD]RFB40877.1 hypothetical protein DZB86_08605 [Bacillus sp. RC]MDC7780172.1 hypothetical protein [Priestia megaterium]MED3969493.1 hypothetical protein [Priestia megaterium]MED4834143.1 hypothetical protein [Priestia megaterium]
MQLLYMVLFLVLIFWGITSFIHYRNQTIKVRLNKHYTNAVEWIEAVKQELEKQGKSVSYEGDFLFKIDEKHYEIAARNMSIWSMSLYHILLQRQKEHS